MKLLIMAFPVNALMFRVIKELDLAEESVHAETAWYPDMIPTCQKIINSFDIEGIYFVGNPPDYVQGLIDQCKNVFDLPVMSVYM